MYATLAIFVIGICLLFLFIPQTEVLGLLFVLGFTIIPIILIALLMRYLIAKDMNRQITMLDVISNIFLVKKIKVYSNSIEIENENIPLSEIKDILFMGYDSKSGQDKSYKIVFHNTASFGNKAYIVIRTSEEAYIPDSIYNLKQESIFINMLIDSWQKTRKQKCSVS
ncbi:hypothetical protein [Neisseria sp. Ec49-e6-T10]|uniref:hypothetical protein n=1 Tax=Neisseria sp. Ec49-e6-T10 TaxID=3140744 RepID=UPI003EB8A701